MVPGDNWTTDTPTQTTCSIHTTYKDSKIVLSLINNGHHFPHDPSCFS